MRGRGLQEPGQGLLRVAPAGHGAEGNDEILRVEFDGAVEVAEGFLVARETRCVGLHNTKTRQDSLSAEQLDALRELGMEWA